MEERMDNLPVKRKGTIFQRSSSLPGTAQHILRLNIIEARGLVGKGEAFLDPFVEVKIGKLVAYTRVVPQTFDPIFNQLFLIEFDELGDSTIVSVRVWNKSKKPQKNLIGEWIGRITDMLNLAGQVQALELQIDRALKGTVIFSCLHEEKRHGALTFRVESAELFAVSGARPAEVRCVVRFADNRSVSRAQELIPMPEGFIAEWNESSTFSVNKINNNRDIFVDIIQEDRILGYTRFTIYEAFRGFAGTKDLIRGSEFVRVGLMYFSLKFEELKLDRPTSPAVTRSTPSSTPSAPSTPQNQNAAIL